MNYKKIKQYIQILIISLIFMFWLHQFIFWIIYIFNLEISEKYAAIYIWSYIVLFILGLFLYTKKIFKVNKKNFLINLLFIIFTLLILFIKSIIDFINVTKSFYVEEVKTITNSSFEISNSDFFNIFIKTTEFSLNNINFRLLSWFILLIILNIVFIYFIRKEIKKG